MNRQYNAIIISGEPQAIQQLIPIIQNMGLPVTVAGEDHTGHRTILVPPICSDLSWVSSPGEAYLKMGLAELLEGFLKSQRFGFEAFSFSQVVYGSGKPLNNTGQLDNRITVIAGAIPRFEDR